MGHLTPTLAASMQRRGASPLTQKPTLPLENRNVVVKSKITGPNLLHKNLSVSDLESSSLAGYFRFIRSNLCTRHIPNKLTPRGHHDWPDKSRNRKLRMSPKSLGGLAIGTRIPMDRPESFRESSMQSDSRSYSG